MAGRLTRRAAGGSAERTPFALQVLIGLTIAEGEAWHNGVDRERQPSWPVLWRVINHHRLTHHRRGGGLGQQLRGEAINAVHRTSTAHTSQQLWELRVQRRM